MKGKKSSDMLDQGHSKQNFRDEKLVFFFLFNKNNSQELKSKCHIYLAIRQGLLLSKMITYNQISPMKCCYNTSPFPKQSERSRSILYKEGSRFLGL